MHVLRKSKTEKFSPKTQNQICISLLIRTHWSKITGNMTHQRNWCTVSNLGNDSSVLLMHYNPSDLEFICLAKKIYLKICFWIDTVGVLYYSAAQIYPNYAYAYYTLVFCVYTYCMSIRVYEYARICPFVTHSYKFLYMKHCWSNKGHMGMKRFQSEICIMLKRHADEWKYHISSFRSLRKFIDRFFDSCLILSF